MSVPRIPPLIAVALVVGCSSADGNANVSEEGFGPVRFGMKVGEAERALGVKLEQDNYTDYDSCRYFTPAEGFTGLEFMTSNGVVVRVDVHDNQEIETDRGAKVGDTEERVLELYKGRTKVHPHFYGGLPDHYIKVLDEKGRTRLLFETRNGKIDNYRAGRLPEVEYVEGCS